MITIEKGYTEPKRRFSIKGKLHEIREAFQKMEPGDSFLFPDNKSLYYAAKQLGVKIRTRKIDGQGFRVWRTL